MFLSIVAVQVKLGTGVNGVAAVNAVTVQSLPLMPVNVWSNTMVMVIEVARSMFES
jgi:hypothetical protein